MARLEAQRFRNPHEGIADERHHYSWEARDSLSDWLLVKIRVDEPIEKTATFHPIAYYAKASAYWKGSYVIRETEGRFVVSSTGDVESRSSCRGDEVYPCPAKETMADSATTLEGNLEPGTYWIGPYAMGADRTILTINLSTSAPIEVLEVHEGSTRLLLTGGEPVDSTGNATYSIHSIVTRPAHLMVRYDELADHPQVRMRDDRSNEWSFKQGGAIPRGWRIEPGPDISGRPNIGANVGAWEVVARAPPFSGKAFFMVGLVEDAPFVLPDGDLEPIP